MLSTCNHSLPAPAKTIDYDKKTELGAEGRIPIFSPSSRRSDLRYQSKRCRYHPPQKPEICLTYSDFILDKLLFFLHIIFAIRESRTTNGANYDT
jgi:hypothetical protein